MDYHIIITIVFIWITGILSWYVFLKETKIEITLLDVIVSILMGPAGFFLFFVFGQNNYNSDKK